MNPIRERKGSAFSGRVTGLSGRLGISGISSVDKPAPEEETTHPVYLIAEQAIVLMLSDWVCRKPFFKTFGIALMVIVLGTCIGFLVAGYL